MSSCLATVDYVEGTVVEASESVWGRGHLEWVCGAGCGSI